ncbi:MAG: TolC family protein [Chitinophagaceae bacterium]|nr:MAG: TolC family protein [Chitinophagaceae bacterium]
MTNKIRYTLKGMIALLVLPFSGSAQSAVDSARTPQVHEFTIQQAVDYASKNNVQVKNALLDVQVQQQTNREVTGSAYPQLSANANLVYNAKIPVSLVPAEFFGGNQGEFAEVAFGLKWNSTYGAAVSQILFDGQVFTGLQARGTLIDFQLKNVEVTEQAIRTNIHKVYYQLVVSKTQIELIDSNIARIRSLSRDTRIMYDNGFAEKMDVDRAEVQLANLMTERVNATNQIRNGYLALKVLMGMPLRDSLRLTDTISDQQVADGVLEASQFSYEQRPDFEYANLGVKLRQYDVQRYKLSKIPTLSLNGYYNRNAQRDQFDIFKGNRNWFNVSAFTLDLKVPIFSGFAVNSRINKARLEERKATNLREQLKIQIDSDIETARNNFSAAINNLEYQKKNMALAENVFNQTKKKFEVGTGSQTEINTAQSDLKLAQTNYINALYNAIIARVDFLKATGKI